MASGATQVTSDLPLVRVAISTGGVRTTDFGKEAVYASPPSSHILAGSNQMAIRRSPAIGRVFRHPKERRWYGHLIAAPRGRYPTRCGHDRS
jgi:hypothetical protein